MRRTAPALLFLLAAIALSSCTDPARERFEGAEKAFLEHRMEDALAGYRSIPTGFPQSRFAPAALLRQGDLYGSYYRNFEAAVEAYGSLLFNYPRSPEAPGALMNRAEILQMHFFDFASAASDLELLRKRYPGFREMDEAMFLLAKAYGGLKDSARQAEVLSELIGRYPDSPRAMEARWMTAYGFLAREMFPEADREFRKILFLTADRNEAARARWGMAQAMEGAGDLDGAIGQYEALRGEWDDPAYIEGKIRRLKGIAGETEGVSGRTDRPGDAGDEKR
ncbi:MAG TPA: tetratricopeptide repeat protein [Candidatus Aquicultoraceae bacterium]|nr:tetratricopeptide repeat protein [Candidatus Aquicultoraceae bacterium]